MLLKPPIIPLAQTNMNFKIVFISCAIYLCTNRVIGQSIPFDRAFFEDKKDEFKSALASLQSGTEFYIQGRKEFEDFKKQYLLKNRFYPISIFDYENSGFSYFKRALGHLLNANRFNPNNEDLNYMLGFIYFYTDSNNPETIKCLEKAKELNSGHETDVNYWLAWCYQINTEWDKALKHYGFHSEIVHQKPKVALPVIDDIKKKMEECRVGKLLCETPERVFVENLGPSINTEFAEYGASITADESNIFFTSRRPGSVGGKKDESDNQFFEDVYFSNRVKNKWQKPLQLSKSVNTEGHDALAGLSQDGNRLFIYRYTAFDGGDLYETKLNGNDWEEPLALNHFINTKYHESSASLSYDGKHLYFISDKETGYGEKDIYVSDLDINGNWAPPHNLGPNINTKYSEDGVFIHPDGVTLYFSSKGHNTMGGYDIFKSTLTNNVWSKPVNLGCPINSPNDDVFFVVSGSGNKAYFSSSKPGGYGDKDLYKITFLGPEKMPILNTQDQLLSSGAISVDNIKFENQIEARASKVTILKGQISDEKTGKFIEANIELDDIEKNINLAVFQSNSSTGKYLISLPSGKNYGITIRAKGYLFYSENFNLPKSTDYQEFTLDFALKKIEIGHTVVLRNIFFDSGKANLKPESVNELERLYNLLKENQQIKIEIISHTDNVGGVESNQKLSDYRSEEVIKYLIQKGISAARLKAIGYGEEKPIASNENAEGRQKNRRTEFKIISK